MKMGKYDPAAELLAIPHLQSKFAGKWQCAFLVNEDVTKGRGNVLSKCKTHAITHDM